MFFYQKHNIQVFQPGQTHLKINNDFVNFAKERFSENFSIKPDSLRNAEITEQSISNVKISDTVMVKANNLLYANKRVGDFLQIK